MELANIEKLLEAYFEGATTEVEEQELRTFFKTEEIPPHMAMYQSMFQGFDQAKEETSQRTISIPNPKRNSRFWNYSAAASLLIAVGVASYMFSNSGYWPWVMPTGTA